MDKYIYINFMNKISDSFECNDKSVEKLNDAYNSIDGREYLKYDGEYILDNNNEKILIRDSNISYDNFYKIKLLDSIDESKDKVERSLNISVRLYIRTLKNFQNYISDKYNSVNDFLYDNNIIVRQSFAYLSELSGFPINEENIEENPSI